MQYSFKDKKVLVTGAGRGIGRDVAKTLWKEGAIVYALTKNPDNLKTLESECPGIKTIVCDLASWTETEKALESLEPVDYLVNNAGVAFKQKLFESTEDVFDLTYNVNVKAVINVTKIISNKMIAAGIKGSIVNVSSVGAFKAHTDLMVYASTKAAVEMLNRSMARQLAPNKIRVNNVNPTVVLTDMGNDLWEQTAAEEYRNLLPLQEFPTTAHCTQAVLFLLSDLSETTTGAFFPVDSGDMLL